MELKTILNNKKTIAVLIVFNIILFYLIISYIDTRLHPMKVEYAFRTLHVFSPIGFNFAIPLFLTYTAIVSTRLTLVMPIILILFRKNQNHKKIIYKIFLVLITLLILFGMYVLADMYIVNSYYNRSLFAYIDFWLMMLPFLGICYVPYIAVATVDYLIDNIRSV